MANRYVWEKWNCNSRVTYKAVLESMPTNYIYASGYFKRYEIDKYTGKITLTGEYSSRPETYTKVYCYWNYHDNPIGGRGDDGYPNIYPYTCYGSVGLTDEQNLVSEFDKYEYTKGSTSYGDVILC